MASSPSTCGAAEDTRIFVKFSKPATKEGDTLNGRPITTATTGAPVFVEALAWMDCEVRQAIDFGTHTFYVGEVVDAALLKPDAKPAAVADTRMKYGGVKRREGTAIRLVRDPRSARTPEEPSAGENVCLFLADVG